MSIRRTHVARTAVAVALAIAFPAGSVAAPIGDEAVIVVTATRQPTRVDQALADVTIIDREEIERSGGGTIADLLARQPGIQTSSSGGAGSATSFYVRGTRTDQTKILVDGLPINSIDLSGSPLRYMPLDNVERIEILRGPASTLYGADAVGGVIQIFTRKGAPGLKADGFIGFGTEKTFQASAGVSGGNEQWRFRIEGNHHSTDGISSRKDATNRDADRDGYRNGGAAASLSFLPARGHELGVIYRRNEGRTHYDESPPNSALDSHVDFRTEQWQLFSHNRFSDKWSSKLQYGQTIDWQDNHAGWTGPQGSAHQTTSRLASWQNDIDLPLGRALLGVERLDQKAYDEGGGFGFTTEAISNDAYYAGWMGSAGQHRWQVNGRHDDHSTFGGKGTYAASYGYQLTEQWRAQASFGTSFKAPSLYQLYVPFFGNALLEPEAGRNREVALIWEKGTHNASATYYLSRIKNMIDFSFATFAFENVSRARLEGLTLTYAGQFGDWGVRATYDWLDATNEDTDLQLGRRARNKALLALSRNWGTLETGVELVGVGRRYDTNNETGEMGGYGLVNLTASYPIGKGVSIEGRFNNLFDKKHETVRGYGTPGFNAFVGIRYTPR